jgi:hypothetical protein
VEQAQTREQRAAALEEDRRQRAASAAEESARIQRQAQEADRLARESAARAPQEPATLSAATVTAPGVGTATEPRTVAAVSVGATAAPEPGAEWPMEERPEVWVGAAFAGAFVVARILRRIFS